MFLVHAAQHVDGDGEDDGGVLLAGDGTQGLQVPAPADNNNLLHVCLNTAYLSCMAAWLPEMLSLAALLVALLLRKPDLGGWRFADPEHHPIATKARSWGLAFC